MIINIHRSETTNTGDKYSSPTLYFDWLKNIPKIDIYKTSINEIANLSRDNIVILGGGGLLSNHSFEEKIKVLIGSLPEMLIGWGVGLNSHFDQRQSKEGDLEELKKFNYLGLSDYGDFGVDWVPCVSCMHPIFDNDFKDTIPIGVYEHKNIPIEIYKYPKLKNSDDFETVINFLGTCEIVITNTYHGIYWATLLNKKVIIISPFSTKFDNIKYQHLTISDSTQLDSIDKSNLQNYPNALGECRTANIDFGKKIKEKLNL